MKSLLLSVAALGSSTAIPPPPVPAAAGTLTLDIWNVRSDKGHVRLDVCPKDKFLKEDCPYSASAPAHEGETRVVVHGLPPGDYAVQAYQDENDDHKVDRIIFGLPKEGIGFSNDAPIHLSPPKWEDARFAFKGGNQTMRIKMRYFLGASGPQH